MPHDTRRPFPSPRIHPLATFNSRKAPPVKVRIVLTGRSYHLAEQLPDSLELTEDASTETVIAHVNQYLPDHQPLPPSCLIILGGEHLGTVASHENRTLCEGDEVELIAPVAGG